MVTSRHDKWSYCDKGAQETIQICRKTGFSFISSTVHRINSSFKAIPFFVSLFPPFSHCLFKLLFFLAGLAVAMEKHPLPAVRYQQTCIRKRCANYQLRMINMRTVTLLSLISLFNQMWKSCKTPLCPLSLSFINICPNLLRKRCPLRIH